MRTFAALIERNRKLFFRDKGMLLSSLFPVFLRKTPMRHETDALIFRYLICLPSDIIFL